MASEEVQFPEESSEIPIRFDNRSIRALPTENLGADCRKPRYGPWLASVARALGSRLHSSRAGRACYDVIELRIQANN